MKNRILKNQVLKKKNSADTIAERRYMKATQNVNIAEADYKKAFALEFKKKKV